MSDTTKNTNTSTPDVPATAAPAAKETPAEKFIRLAEPRVCKILDDFDALAKLSGRAYAFTPEQAKTMFTAISDKANTVAAKFAAPGGETTEKKKGQFSF